MLGSFHNRTLDENDFNFFYHLEQISGSLLLESFPETSHIILPNLRIIRGVELEGDRHAVVLINVSISGDIIFPKLTEISRGNVYINQPANRRIYNWGVVNWPDILDDGDIVPRDGESIMSLFDNCIFQGVLYHNTRL